MGINIFSRIFKRAAKITIALDMAFHKPDFDVHYSRYTPSVTMAGSILVSVLQHQDINGLINPIFMEKPLIEGHRGFSKKNNPKFFFISLYDKFFKKTAEEAKRIREKYPDAFIIIGGPSINTTENLKKLAPYFPASTVFFKGDGEKIQIELLKLLAQASPNQPFEPDFIEKLNNTIEKHNIKGLYMKHFDFEIYNNEENKISEVEFEATPRQYDLPELIKDIKKQGWLRLSTSRGCPYRCVFCSHKIHFKQIRWSPQRSIQELKRIRHLIKKGILPEEAKNLVFDDDDFFLKRGAAKEFLNILLEDKQLSNYFTFSFQGSVKSLNNQELLDLLARLNQYNMTTLYIGTDTLDQEDLIFLDKPNNSIEEAFSLIDQLEQRKIRQVHYIILITPIATRENLLETIRKIELYMKLCPTFIPIFVAHLSVYENTPLFDWYIRNILNVTKLPDKYKDRKFFPQFVFTKDKQIRAILSHLFSVQELLDIYIKYEQISEDRKIIGRLFDQYQKESFLLIDLLGSDHPIIKHLGLLALKSGLEKAKAS